MDWERLEVSPHDLEDEGGKRGRLEGPPQGAHLVQDAAEGPHVALGKHPYMTSVLTTEG